MMIKLGPVDLLTCPRLYRMTCPDKTTKPSTPFVQGTTSGTKRPKRPSNVNAMRHSWAFSTALIAALKDVLSVELQDEYESNLNMNQTQWQDWPCRVGGLVSLFHCYYLYWRSSILQLCFYEFKLQTANERLFTFQFMTCTTSNMYYILELPKDRNTSRYMMLLNCRQDSCQPASSHT